MSALALCTKFKKSKSINFEKSLKTYITKYYDENSYNDIESFIIEFQQNREVVVNLSNLEKTYEKLKSYREVVINYLNMIWLLKSKVNFGKEDYSLKIEFSWSDTLRNDNYESHNVNFDFYSCLFNLGVINNLLAINFVNSKEDQKLKEGIKFFQNAAWIFDKIKQEYPIYISVKDTQPDLSSNYLSYCSYICLASAQTLLLKVAENKNMALELQASLAKGVSDLYGSALNLSNDSLKNLIIEAERIYLNNRKFYYSAIAFIKTKEVYADLFAKTGEGYGKQIGYLGLACECLNISAKDFNKISSYLNISDFNEFKEGVESLRNEMIDKNLRIYFNPVPDMNSLTKVEKNIKVNPTGDEFLKTNNTVLDKLVPLEVRSMIGNYKNQMMEYISQNLDKLENEAKITKFLKELNLPFSLETSTEGISDSLWKRISEIQQKGGSLYLTNQIQNLQKKSEEISALLRDSESIIFTEEQEDDKFRSIYANKWQRQSSQSLNLQYKQIINEYKYKYEIAKNLDNQIKNSLNENINFFDLLSYPQQIIEKKIPKGVSPETSLKEREEFILLKKELDILDENKDRCMEIIEKIFQNLNEDNIVPQFLQVLQKKTTEKAIFTENKIKYDPLFTDLSLFSSKISEIKIEIKIKNEKFLLIKSQNNNNEEKEKYLRQLEDYIIKYNHILINLNQGMNFYNEFNLKLNDLNSKLNDYIIARGFEKEEILSAISRGENYELGTGNNLTSPGTRGLTDAPSYLNPEFNPITNLNYTYRYNK